MNNVIGTCSKCGGPVKMPTHMVDPVACCARCGATAKNSYGPVIQMVGGGEHTRTGSPYDLSTGDKGFVGIRNSRIR